MKQTIHAVDEQKERTGTFNGLAFVGYEYEEGWLVSVFSVGNKSPRLLWVDGNFAAPRVSEAAPSSLNGLGLTEVNAQPIDVTPEVKEATLAMIWEWEVWEPITVAGTCAIDSLVRCWTCPKTRCLPGSELLAAIPACPRRSSSLSKRTGYTVDIAGPEGSGKFHEHHRLVAMYRKDDPTSGHVILIYAFDKGVFDATGVFKEVSHILWSDRFGYNRGFVWRIQKR